MLPKDIRVEAPRGIGRETEFFLQRSNPCTVACAAHIHNAIELLYINKGSYTVLLDNVRYEMYPGDLILFCSNAIHHVLSGEEADNSYYVIKIPPSFFIDLCKQENGVNYSMRFALHRKEYKCVWRSHELKGSAMQPLLDCLVKEYTEQQYATEIATKLKIMELLLAILRESIPSELPVSDTAAAQIYSVMRYVQEYYASDLDERELARAHGMSYSYFSRKFKCITGMTFRCYLNRTRISNAERLLFKGGSSVSEIACACGYNNTSYFISVYRALTGKTPYQAMKSVMA